MIYTPIIPIKKANILGKIIFSSHNKILNINMKKGEKLTIMITNPGLIYFNAVNVHPKYTTLFSSPRTMPLLNILRSIKLLSNILAAIANMALLSKNRIDRVKYIPNSCTGYRPAIKAELQIKLNRIIVTYLKNSLISILIPTGGHALLHAYLLSVT
jgi:hypothetical protein